MSISEKFSTSISAVSRFANELSADVRAKKTTPALSAGITAGLGLLVAQVAFATFIFSGALSPYTSQGIGLILFGNFAACLIMATTAGFRGVIAGLSPALVIGMAVFGSTMTLQGHALFVTVCATLILAAVVTGVSCYLVGKFRIANLLRFIPYPVSAGFVAGIGGAVCLAAMSLLGTEIRWNSIHELLQPSAAVRWGPGICYGVALYAALKKWGNPLILPLSVVFVVIGYHLALAAIGITSDEARTMGLLLTSTTEGNLWPVLGFTDLALVEWMAIVKQIPNMLALILVAYICVILNIAGLEVATNQELDWNREFRAGGTATFVAGLGGGTIATVVIPASLRSKILGGTTRLTGIVAALVIATALFVGDGLLEFVPTLLVGGILVFAGLGMLDEGLLKSSRQLPLSEFGIVLMIFLTILTLGLLEGAGVGVLATLVLFVVRLSRVDVVKAHFTARERRSHRTLSIPERAILLEEGSRAQAYLLRGYVFFGSVSTLVDRVRTSFASPTRGHCLLIDFEEVTGFDYSAINVFSRLLQELDSHDVNIVLSRMPNSFSAGLERNIPPQTYERFHLEANMEKALERCEDIVIGQWEKRQTSEEHARLLRQTSDELVAKLNRQEAFEELIEKMPLEFDQRSYLPDETLFSSENQTDSVQLLLSGQVSAYDATGVRLYQLGPGEVLTPTRAQSEFVSSVVADGSCSTLVLTPSALNHLEHSHPELALELYKYLFTHDF